MQFLGKYARLSRSDQTLRLRLLDYGLAHPGDIPASTALTLAGEVKREDGGDWAGLTPADALNSLDERHYMRRREDGAIRNLYPLSCGDETDYHVTLADGRSFFAMCAIDAMGCAVTFHQPIEVRSILRDTEEEIFLRLSPEDGLIEATPDNEILVTYYDTMKHYIDFNC